MRLDFNFFLFHVRLLSVLVRLVVCFVLFFFVCFYLRSYFNVNFFELKNSRYYAPLEVEYRFFVVFIALILFV